jgi:hypothetical protein
MIAQQGPTYIPAGVPPHVELPPQTPFVVIPEPSQFLPPLLLLLLVVAIRIINRYRKNK